MKQNQRSGENGAETHVLEGMLEQMRAKAGHVPKSQSQAPEYHDHGESVLCNAHYGLFGKRAHYLVRSEESV